MGPLSALFVFVYCWITCGAMIVFGVREWRIWRRGVSTMGTVTKVERDSDGHLWLVIEYRFGTATRQCVYRRAGRAGDTVSLLVDPSAPDDAMLRESETGVLIGILFLWVTGASIGLGGTVPLASHLRNG